MIRAALVLLLVTGGHASGATPFRLQPQVGVNTATTAIALSPDGRYAMSTTDTELAVWDVGSGGLIITTHLPHGKTDGVVFLGDSTSAATLAGGVLTLWEIPSMRATEIVAHPLKGGCLTYLPRARQLLTCGAERKLKVWKRDGVLIRALDLPGGNPNVLSASQDEDTIATGGLEAELRVWRLSSGESIAVVPASQRTQDFVVSPDATTLVWAKFKMSSSDRDTVQVTDLKSSTTRALPSAPGTNDPTGLRYSADGRHLILTALDAPITLWDVATWTPLPNFAGTYRPRKVLRKVNLIGEITAEKIPERQPSVFFIALSADGTTLLTNSGRSSFSVWEVASGSRIRDFPAHHLAQQSSARFSPDGDRLMTDGLWGSAVWDTVALDLIEHRPARFKFAGWASSTGDGHYTVYESLNVLQVWDNTAHQSSRWAASIHRATLSSDGSLAIGQTPDSSRAVAVQLADGAELTSCPLTGVATVDAADDSRHLLVGLIDRWPNPEGPQGRRSSELRVLNLDCSVLRSFELKPFDIRAAAMTADGSMIAATASRRRWAIWSGDSDQPRVASPEGASTVTTLAFSPDGKMLLLGEESGALEVVSTANGRTLRKLSGHSRPVSSLSFSSHRDLAASTSDDGTTRLWNTVTWESVVLAFDLTDWLVYDDKGNFDASLTGSDLLAVVSEDRAIPIDQFAAELNRPDVLLKRLGVAPAATIDLFAALHLRRSNRLGLSKPPAAGSFHLPSASLKATQAEKKVTLQLDLKDAEVDLRAYNVFANNVPLFGPGGKPVKGRHASIREVVELTAGENRIEVSATNVLGAESFRTSATFKYAETAPLGELHFFGFGVSTYVDESLKLNYAAKDAEDLAKVLDRPSPLFRTVSVHPTRVDQQVTPDSLTKVRAILETAKVDDTVVLFFSGHGFRANDRDETFYFLPYGASLKALAKTAISLETIEELMQGIPPRRRILILDACESGEVDPTTTKTETQMPDLKARKILRRRDIRPDADQPALQAPVRLVVRRDRFIYADMRRRAGAAVISASHGDEASYESQSLKQGLLTRALIESLEQSGPDDELLVCRFTLIAAN